MLYPSLSYIFANFCACIRGYRHFLSVWGTFWLALRPVYVSCVQEYVKLCLSAVLGKFSASRTRFAWLISTWYPLRAFSVVYRATGGYAPLAYNYSLATGFDGLFCSLTKSPFCAIAAVLASHACRGVIICFGVGGPLCVYTKVF